MQMRVEEVTRPMSFLAGQETADSVAKVHVSGEEGVSGYLWVGIFRTRNGGMEARVHSAADNENPQSGGIVGGGLVDAHGSQLLFSLSWQQVGKKWQLLPHPISRRQENLTQS